MDYNGTPATTHSPATRATNVMPRIAAATNPVAYVRFHGRNGDAWERGADTGDDRMSYDYRRGDLEPWAPRLAKLAGAAKSVHVLFTTGAADDIRRATNLARRMVTEFGFSDKLGPLRYTENEEEVFLGHSVTQRKNVSDATAKVIDEEIRRIVEEGELKARKILTEHLEELHSLARGLLEFETLSADEIKRTIQVELGQIFDTSHF